MTISQSDRYILRACRESLARNAKSFSLAGKLLAADALDRAAALYAYCRRVDDAIDDTPRHDQTVALQELQDELARVYDGGRLSHPAALALRALAHETALPKTYLDELLLGMEMDVTGRLYETLDDLLLYCHRVAGVVGLMMCHVLGVTRDEALVPAAQLGIGMQLTNIARDVGEDWEMGRLYLPQAWLREEGYPLAHEGARGELPSGPVSRHAFARVTERLLAEADRYYDASRRGVVALPLRAGMTVRAAHYLYRDIGRIIAQRHYDPSAPRAVVPKGQKLWLLGRAAHATTLSVPALVWDRARTMCKPRTPRAVLAFPAELLA